MSRPTYRTMQKTTSAGGAHNSLREGSSEPPRRAGKPASAEPKSNHSADLGIYSLLNRFLGNNYRLKVLTIAFFGTQIPLAVVLVYFAVTVAPDWQARLALLGVVLFATVLATGLTMWLLSGLIRPVLKTSGALQAYRSARTITPLPGGYRDAAGTLMQDTHETLLQLERIRDRIETIDDTTGLPNRARIVATLNEMIAQEEPFHLAVIRLANAGRITDAVDKDAREQAIRAIARRLGATLPENITLGRIDVDTFVAVTLDTVVHNCTSTIGAALPQCTRTLAAGGIAVKPALTVGIAAFPDDGSDAETLLETATAAGATSLTTPVVAQTPGVRRALLDRRRLEDRLQDALEQKEFCLFYQPVVDLAANRIRAAEALLRWRTDGGRIHLPEAFIPVAEASGLMEPIAWWVLNEACRQMVSWADEGRGPERLAVNLSMEQFLDPNLTNRIVDTLSAHDLSPVQLQVEVTEFAATDDHEYTRRVFGQLREAGIGVTLDNFGRAFAGIGQLHALPFDTLKIDRSFIQGVHRRPSAQAVCAALVSLTGGLGRDLVAEGVELLDEVRYLEGIGLRLFQGYYFGRPAPPEVYTTAIDAQAPPAGVIDQHP
ncbi:putative bifunctional diguanylate cyclase/phosphodiesterase [Acuticoccus mangrovi]|uniref:EAL domain-containing protein n=1 Tax=Acuticoccus mangrovi TaxID=2796142 RepID=A0A934MJ07_9HYPH|nr:GGDEF domain-containing phosphodiesterase [Acuticoccus mangrovi]MBJ3777761.1 EAL domain-containing protein [Acuticoccus mangrovi]